MKDRSFNIILAGLIVIAFGAAQRLPGSIAFGATARLPGAPRSRPTLTPVSTAAPRPTLTPLPAGRLSGSADICLRLSTEPGGAIPPASIAAYQLVARNSGQSDAADVRITLPFARDAQTPLDAAFSAGGAWVSAVLTDSIELRLDALRRGQTITATLWLHTSPAVLLDSDLTTRARLRWSGDGGSARLSNRAPLVVAQHAEERQAAALAIEPPAGSPATTFALAYDGFASNERVSLWYHRPDGGSVGLGEVRADEQGRIIYRLAASALGEGGYTVVAAGQCSRVAAIGIVTITGSQPALPPAP